MHIIGIFDSDKCKKSQKKLKRLQGSSSYKIGTKIIFIKNKVLGNKKAYKQDGKKIQLNQISPQDDLTSKKSHTQFSTFGQRKYTINYYEQGPDLYTNAYMY